jgi:hypothetical protein
VANAKGSLGRLPPRPAATTREASASCLASLRSAVANAKGSLGRRSPRPAAATREASASCLASLGSAVANAKGSLGRLPPRPAATTREASASCLAHAMAASRPWKRNRVSGTAERRVGWNRRDGDSRSPHRLRDCGFLGYELSEGLPVTREPAYDAKRSHDGEAQAASE